MSKQSKYILIGALLLFLIVAIPQKTFDGKDSIDSRPSPVLRRGVGGEADSSISLIVGDKTIQLIVLSNQTLYEALYSKENAGKISFKGKNYSGLGFFLTDIEDLHAGSGKNLLYYINGHEATVGVSSYFPKNGDSIVWKLE